jgi:glycosyltransferase involved in cell wall biosynthesis
MRIVVEPINGQYDRPLWSVMIPAYNRGVLLREALQSVLVQDAGPEQMHIEVIDDASTECLQSIVAEVGKGRVSFFRQVRNVGQWANFATCLQRARGKIVHLLHGDDMVRPGFYDALERGFASNGEIGAAFCRWQTIDEVGKVTAAADPEAVTAGALPDALARLASEQRVVTPSIAVRREVYERLGGFDSRLQCAEDWEMWVRIAAHYPVWYEPHTLACYRQHSDSTSAAHYLDASELRDTLRAIKMFEPLLPRSRSRQIVSAGRRAYARTALDNARELSRRERTRAARAHLLMALRLWPRPSTALEAAQILTGRGG